MKLHENKELFEELSQAVQWAGTLTVIHTNAVAHRIGISATEFEAMDLITRFQPITAGKLAEYCGLTTGAITGMVDRLERQGFVRRERDPDDRRRVFILPIENKERSKKVRALYRPIAKGFEEYVEKYSEDEVCMLIRMQKEANAMVERSIACLRQKD
ncbi:MarR family transcriptional regulator [Streptomyces caniscabiei]|uniref:MarR family transcriptional regulator n=1 Tax=Streptomyces caniscabiei TaxID=2746961 RepID=UPI0029ACA1DF|nr:MarR family transcriptional regulator [Streptomyces caniscabiei]MDX2775749.1 MarR family transcriptional regulator [Streptomyces caniscabiei]